MKRIAMVAATLSLMTAAPAVASTSPTCGGYNPDCSSLAANTMHSKTTTTTTTAAAGTLPFTGLDVGLLLAGGGMLAGLGLVIRRVSSKPTD